MDDIFTQVGNRKRVYALSQYSVKCTVQGWWFRRTDREESWCGPFSTEMSVALMIAKRLCIEVKKRDGLPTQCQALA